MKQKLEAFFKQHQDTENFKLSQESNELSLVHGVYYGYSMCCIKSFTVGDVRDYQNPLDGTGCILCKKCAKDYENNPEAYQAKMREQRFCETPFPGQEPMNEIKAIKFEVEFFKLLTDNPLSILQNYTNSSYKFAHFVDVPKIYLKCKDHDQETNKKYDITGFLLNKKEVLIDFLDFVKNPKKHKDFFYTECFETLHYYFKYNQKRTPLFFEDIAYGADTQYDFNHQEIKDWLQEHNSTFKPAHQKIKNLFK